MLREELGNFAFRFAAMLREELGNFVARITVHLVDVRANAARSSRYNNFTTQIFASCRPLWGQNNVARSHFVLYIH